MRVGLLADIHGNRDALVATLDAVRAQGVQRVLCCGDFVDYYYEPDRCLDLLAEWDRKCVLGNHENMLSRFMKEPSLADDFRRRYGSGPSVAARALLDAVTGAYQHHTEEHNSEPVALRARETDSHLPFLWEILGHE